MIYIVTNEHGRGIRHVTGFEDRDALHSYACEVLCRYDHTPRSKATISDICDALDDNGIGYGARSHHRVSYREARLLVRNGVQPYGF